MAATEVIGVLGDERWVEVTPSQFPHEAEGLRLLRELLPDEPPFRVWTNFEFRDDQGKWHEVDAIVLGRRRMHLIELKYYSGTLRGNDSQWLRDGHRAEDSPLKLARRKAQRLASKLQDELRRYAQEKRAHVPDVKLVVPYVQEAVFLHHPQLRCALPIASRQDLFGPTGLEHDTGLAGIDSRILEPAENNPRFAINNTRSEIVAALMSNIGAVQRRQREAGSWIIDDQPLDEGEGWQDWPAFHCVSHQERARIRFFVSAPGTSEEQQKQRRQLADHEFRAVHSLNHDGILRPTDLVETELGVGLVYPQSSDFQRLDLWLADHPAGVPLAAQLSVIRQIAEAVGYAHRHRVVHRGLTPAAVLVRDRAEGSVEALVTDWQVAGKTKTTSARATTIFGSSVIDLANGADAAKRGAYQAPEGVWQRDADRVRLDVFSLGAVAYYLLTRRAPAPDSNALRERLSRDKGLDVAADVPQVLSSLRALVRDATHPKVSDRLPSVAAFLDRLADVEQALTEPEPGTDLDPLTAPAKTVFRGRYRLEKRLGSGSTAVALLISDEQDDGKPAVLKAALDDAAGARLADEAEVLRKVNNPRIAKLLDGPLRLGKREALVIEFAGEQTLADVLAGRGRLSLDLLERFGTDLLEAVVALETTGLTHRDIKPANLGLHTSASDRTRHLMLFDFSLAREDPRAVTAGTLGYRDPWLGTASRNKFDSAAELYSTAVVLYEMATGSLPTYGDGVSDPVATSAALVNPGDQFDPTVAQSLRSFFDRALAPAAGNRFGTATELLAAWRQIFASVPQEPSSDADKLAEAATVETDLAEAGLSVRARSALEPLGVATVGDLIVLDPVALNHMRGAAYSTRQEVKARAKQWRERLGSAARPRPVEGAPTVHAAVHLLASRFGRQRSKRADAVRLLLGISDNAAVDAFIPTGDLGEAVNASRQRGPQLIAEMQQAWADDAPSRELLASLTGTIWRVLDQLGGVATVAELTAEICALLPSSDGDERPAAGLLRVALDRTTELDRAQALEEPFARRRRDGRLLLLARRPELITAAEILGREADLLVAAAGEADEPVVTASRATARLRTALAADLDEPSIRELLDVEATRLLRLAAEVSRTAAVAGNGDLHSRDLPLAKAIALALSGLAASQAVGAQELRDRVRARFPALPALPERPRLDTLLNEAGIRLMYDDAARMYRFPAVRGNDTSLHTRVSTSPASTPAPFIDVGGHVATRLRDSARSRSFLALGATAEKVDDAKTLLVERYGATPVDLTAVLIDAMRTAAAAAGLSWDVVRAADAAAPGTRDAAGLAALVQRVLPAIDEAVEQAASAGAPVLLTEAAPLARYGHLSVLAKWSDLAAPRPQAIWLLVPLLHGIVGALVDGKPIMLGAPGQFVKLDDDWLYAAGASGESNKEAVIS